MEFLNSATPPIDFSPQEYQRLIQKYLAVSQRNDRLVRTIRTGTPPDLQCVRQALQTDFPLYAQLQDYFSRMRTRGLEAADLTPFTFDDPVLGSVGDPLPPVDVNMEGGSEMQLASEHDPDTMSSFFGSAVSVFTERPPVVSNEGPFGIRFSDFPPRVISQMRSIQSDVAASSCRRSRYSLRADAYHSFF